MKDVNKVKAQKCSRCVCLALALGLVFSGLAGGLAADDWPQWMGPNRDSVWSEDGIMETFPEGGLEQKWSVEIDGGYAGPAVANGKVYVTDYQTSGDRSPSPSFRNDLQGTERIICLNAETGEEIWTHTYDCHYGIAYPAGPRVTPTVDGDRVYSVGAMGNLFCLDADSGDEIWSRDFRDEFDTEAPLWGFCGHPLVDGDLLICLVGGEGSAAVAFNKHTGEEVWRSLTCDDVGYCPPTMIVIGDRRQLIIWHSESINSLNPIDGSVYWSVPLNPDYQMSIAAPRLAGNKLFVGGMGNKSLLLELGTGEPSAEIVWRGERERGIGPVNMTPIVDGDHLYGVDRRGYLIGLEIESGKHLWSTFEPVSGDRPAGSGTAFIVRHEDRYFLFNEQGKLLIAKMTPDGFEEIDRTDLIEPTTIGSSGRHVVWTHPAFANRCVFVRNDNEIVCYSLAE